MYINNSPSRNIYKQSFKAKPVAKVQLRQVKKGEPITIYSLSKKDIPFLVKMLEHLNLKKLYPNLKNTQGFDEWYTLISQAVTDINEDMLGFLAVRNNKPCGILSYYELNKNSYYHISHLATWPTEPNTGTKCAGKALIRHFFQKCTETDAKYTFLLQSDITPRDKSCRQFYKDVGFAENPFSGVSEIRQPKEAKYNIFKIATQKLDEELKYKRIKKAEEIDLNKVLDVNYTPNILDKIEQKFKDIVHHFEK